MTTIPLEELYRIISSPLVRHPDDLIIHGQEGTGSCNIIVACNSDDQGRLIGAGGRMYKACDYVVRTAGIRLGVSARLIIESDFRSTHELRPFSPKAHWTKPDNDYLEALLWEILGYAEDGPFEIHASNVSKWGTVVLVKTYEALEDQMKLSLETIVGAIGKAKGRFVYLDFGKIPYEIADKNLRAR